MKMIDDSKNTTYALFQDIGFYYTPILVHLGLLGNCLSVCVFFGTKLRHASSSIYLSALAISDTGFLIVAFIAWLDMVHIYIFNKQGFCQFFVYFGYLCSFLSVWLVVTFTVERYIAVKYPLRRQSLCTVARAKTAVIVLTILAIILCTPMLLFSEPQYETFTSGNKTICDLATGWKPWAAIHNGIDTVLTFALPLTIIVIFNTLIARNIYKHDNIRRAMTIESDASNKRNTDTHNPRNRVSQTKTKMLLLISSAFLCLNTPAFVIRVVIFFYDEQHPEPLSVTLAYEISNLLFNTSFGINFVLYCASGHNFRREMVRMFMRRSKFKRSGAVIEMANHRKQCQLMHKSNSEKRHSANNSELKNCQETQKSYELTSFKFRSWKRTDIAKETLI